MLHLFLFTLFSVISISAAFLMIFNKNPIHSILYLALVFLCVGCLFLMLNVDFIAMLFLVVYLGALIVLFLFVVMMLNVKIIELKEKLIQYLPIGGFIALIFFLQIIYILGSTLSFTNYDFKLLFNNNLLKSIKTIFIENNIINSETFINKTHSLEFFNNISNLTNIQSLAQILYTDYAYFFIIAGMILLVAMLGSIVLTLNQEFVNKRQDIYLQIDKNINKAILLRNVY